MAAQQTRNIGELLSRPEIALRIEELKRRNAMITSASMIEGADTDEDFDYGSLIGVVYASINGQNDIKDQTVRVEYLTSEQLLRIPAGLAMTHDNREGALKISPPAYLARLKRASAYTYAQIVDLVQQAGTSAEKKVIVDAVPLPPGPIVVPDWKNPTWWNRGNNQMDDRHIAAYTFSCFSKILGFNFDVRDYGWLNEPNANSRVTDRQWQQPIGDVSTRFIAQVQPYTLVCIAAMNYEAVGNWAIGAWVRAYGVGCGILPDEHTRLNKEWIYDQRPPSSANLARVTDGQSLMQDEAQSLCLNILAMFGLFHLSKNHTFKTGDANMERIGISYINTLRTMATNPILEDIRAHQEAAVRTAAHPFGLAQTYWLALALQSRASIAIPLGLRTSVTPPPVQRLMIVHAAHKEWSNLPVGQILNGVFQDKINVVANEIAVIMETPPSYSELHRFYGVANRLYVSDEAKDAADAMMPIVDGFAKALHVSEGDKRDGLALAQCFANVERDYKSMTSLYASQWKNYLETMDTSGLEETLTKVYKSRMALSGEGPSGA